MSIIFLVNTYHGNFTPLAYPRTGHLALKYLATESIIMQRLVRYIYDVSQVFENKNHPSAHLSCYFFIIQYSSLQINIYRN